MAMTPIDIRNKEFRKSIRGYQCSEVDKFNELVSKEFESIYAENFELKEKIKRLENQLAHYVNLENTLQQTMLLAQQTAEEVKQAARHEADLILKAAEQEKNRQFSETEARRKELQHEIQELSHKREVIRTQLKAFLTAQLELAEYSEKGVS